MGSLFTLACKQIWRPRRPARSAACAGTIRLESERGAAAGSGMSTAEKRLAALGVELPAVPQPIGQYIPYRRSARPQRGHHTRASPITVRAPRSAPPCSNVRPAALAVMLAALAPANHVAVRAAAWGTCYTSPAAQPAPASSAGSRIRSLPRRRMVQRGRPAWSFWPSSAAVPPTPTDPATPATPSDLIRLYS